MAALVSNYLRHFRLLLWNRWPEFNETDGKQNLNVHWQVCVFGPIGKQDGCPGLWLAKRFRLLLWNHWKEFNETCQEERFQRLLQSLCFRAVRKKTRWPPWSLIPWDIFDFSSEPLTGIQRNLTESKISTSTAQSVSLGLSIQRKVYSGLPERPEIVRLVQCQVCVFGPIGKPR